MELAKLTVERRKDSNAIGKFFGVIVGDTLVLIGLLLCVTIIGIIPGIGSVMLGLLMLAAAVRNMQTVQCPQCKKRVNIQKDIEDFKCPRCSTPVVVEWKRTA